MARTLQCTPDVLGVLQDCTIQENRLILPAGQLERKLYAQVNRVIEALGGAWNRKAKAHLFAGDPREALAQVLDQGAVTMQPSQQQVYQEFWSPPWLADQMVALAQVQPGEAVCDPSAGTGHLLDAVLRVPGYREHRTSLLVGYEIQPERARTLEQKYGAHVLIWCGDFLTHQSPAVHERLAYHVLLLNPPFAKGQDIAHVTHALGWLERGGRLVAVMPESIHWRKGKAADTFRALLDSWAATCTPLPEDTFQESGAHVKTLLVRFERPQHLGMHQQDVTQDIEAGDRVVVPQKDAAPPQPLASPSTATGAQQLTLF